MNPSGASRQRTSLTPYLLVAVLLFSIAYPAINQTGYLDWIKPVPGEDDDTIDVNGTEPDDPNPVFVDSDGDGWSDDFEMECGSDPDSPSSYPIVISGYCESVMRSSNVTIVNPFRPFNPELYPELNISIIDSDGDNWSDFDEFPCRTNPYETDDVPIDIDRDGQCEYIDRDDDNDNYTDIIEVRCGSDRNNSLSVPVDTNHNGICDGREIIQLLQDSDYYWSSGDLPDFIKESLPFNYDLFSFDWQQIYVPDLLNNMICSIHDIDEDLICNRQDIDDDGDGWSDIEEFICGSNYSNPIDFPELNDSIRCINLNPLLIEKQWIKNYTLSQPPDWRFPPLSLTYDGNSSSPSLDYASYIQSVSNLSHYNLNYLRNQTLWFVGTNIDPIIQSILNCGPKNIGESFHVKWNGSVNWLTGGGGYIWNYSDSSSYSCLYNLFLIGLIDFFIPIKLINQDIQWSGDGVPDYVPIDPYYYKQWNFKSSDTYYNIEIEQAWNISRGDGIVFSVIDVDGIQYNHTDLENNLHPLATNYWNRDYCSSIDNDPIPSGTDSAHGTAVTGLITAEEGNGKYIVGASFNSTYYAQRIGNSDDNCSLSTAEQMGLALSHLNSETDIYISSTSFPSFSNSFTHYDSEMLNLTYQGRGGQGSILVVSAGNDNNLFDNSNYNYLSSSRFSISVTSIDIFGNRINTAENGSNIMLVAPSSSSSAQLVTLDLMGAEGDNDGSDQHLDMNTTYFSGTSAAAPQVAGVVGLILSANDNLTWRDVQYVLFESSDKINPSHSSWGKNGVFMDISFEYGFGLVNATESVNRALNWTLVPNESNMSAGQYGLSQTIPGNDANWTEIIVELDQTDVQPHKHAFFMESAEVHLDIDHQRRGDLEIRLISPFGTESILSEVFDPTDSTNRANGPLNWTFTTVHNWGENALFQYQDLEEDVGKWTIKIRDNSSLNLADGILRGWSLHLHGHEGVDSDGDGYSDYEENRCNSNASDPSDYPINTDGLDWCDFLDDDDDNDGWSDTSEDDCGTDSLSNSDIPADLDSDWICDVLDDDIDGDNWLNDVESNCSTNPYSEFSVPYDTDRDGICDFLDLDIDGDSFNNTYENYCLTNPYYSWEYPTDFDSDGLCDSLDEDDDNDSWNDTYEIDCLSDPLDDLSIPADNDSGGLCDALDNDDDNDLIPDWLDANPLVPNGTGDWLPLRPPIPGTPGAPPPWMDSDDDGVPDWQDPDYWYDEDNSDYPEGTDTSSNPPPWVEGPR